MLEHMGDPGFSPGLVSGAHTVPDLERDQGRLVVLQQDDLQAIGQDGFKDLIPEACL